MRTYVVQTELPIMPDAHYVESPLFVPQEKVLSDSSTKRLGSLPHQRHQLIHGVCGRMLHSVQVANAEGGEVLEKLGL